MNKEEAIEIIKEDIKTAIENIKICNMNDYYEEEEFLTKRKEKDEFILAELDANDKKIEELEIKLRKTQGEIYHCKDCEKDDVIITGLEYELHKQDNLINILIEHISQNSLNLNDELCEKNDCENRDCLSCIREHFEKELY